MSIITKGAVAKGIPTSFYLNKTNLVALVSDSYYQNQNNWKSIVLNYESSEGGQKSKVIFNAGVTTPEGSFLISNKARDIFEIKQIMIYDFDGGHYAINRTELTSSQFDVDLSAPTSDLALFTGNPDDSDSLGQSATSIDSSQFKIQQEFVSKGAQIVTQIDIAMGNAGNTTSVFKLRLMSNETTVLAESTNEVAASSIAAASGGLASQLVSFMFEDIALTNASSYRWELYVSNGQHDGSVVVGSHGNIYPNGYGLTKLNDASSYEVLGTVDFFSRISAVPFIKNLVVTTDETNYYFNFDMPEGYTPNGQGSNFILQVGNFSYSDGSSATNSTSITVSKASIDGQKKARIQASNNYSPVGYSKLILLSDYM